MACNQHWTQKRWTLEESHRQAATHFHEFARARHTQKTEETVPRPGPFVSKVDVSRPMMEPPPHPRDQWPLRKKAKLNPPQGRRTRRFTKKTPEQEHWDATQAQQERQCSARLADFQNRSRRLAAMAYHSGLPPNRAAALAALNHPRCEQSWAIGSSVPANRRHAVPADPNQLRYPRYRRSGMQLQWTGCDGLPASR